MEDTLTSYDETQRLASLYGLKVLDTPPEDRFDKISFIATRLFKVPISTMTLVDSNREWYKSCQGVSEKENSRTISFCAKVVESKNDIFVINDTYKDERFSNNQMVVGPPYVRFYAGVPIFSIDGKRVGAFCIKDTKPREFSQNDGVLLQTLASWAEIELNVSELNRILTSIKNNEPNSVDKDKINLFLSRLLGREVSKNIRALKVQIKMIIPQEEQDKLGINESTFEGLEELILKLERSLS